jgi:flagellar basal body rod protein FlgB
MFLQIPPSAEELEKQSKRHITHVALLLRMTSEERIAIKNRRSTDDEVEDIMFIMEKAEYVDLDDEVTQFSLNKLYQKGLFEDGRIETILTEEVKDKERPEK